MNSPGKVGECTDRGKLSSRELQFLDLIGV